MASRSSQQVHAQRAVAATDQRPLANGPLQEHDATYAPGPGWGGDLLSPELADAGRVPAGAQGQAWQAKLEVSSPGDAFENEADVVAERVDHVMDEGGVADGADGGDDDEPAAGRSVMRRVAPATAVTGGAPTDAVERLVTGHAGAPLSGSVRKDLEPRLGWDLSEVRIHTGPEADRAASSVGARALTVGHAIAFRDNEYRPGTPEGRRLLAHELTHVAQQQGAAPRIQRRARSQPPPARKKPTGHRFTFRVTVDRELDSDALLLEFARQYHHLATTEEARAQIAKENWHWHGVPRTVTAAEAAQGFVLIPVTLALARTPQKLAETAQAVEALSPEQKQSLNDRTDAAFYQATGSPPRTRLTRSEADQEQAAYWLQLRSQIADLDALSPEVKAFMFDATATKRLDPHDYALALRLARKVEAMTPAQRADYKSKVTGQTTDLNDLDRAIDGYNLGADVRENQAEERGRTKTRLTGHLGLYRRAKAFRSLERRAANRHRDREGFEYGPDPSEVTAEREALTKELNAANYATIEAFEAMCDEYRKAFVKETVSIAKDTLARYEHVLWEQERRYQDGAAAGGIHERVQASGAAGHYQEARDLRGTADMIMPDLGGYGRGDRELKSRLRDRAGAEEAAGEAAVRAATPDEPLIAEGGFNRKGLASADAGEVRSMLTEYIAERRSDIAKSRRHLDQDPELIFKLDLLYTTSLGQQNVDEGSIYYEIVDDRRQQIHRDENLVNFLIAILAIALGLLTMGTGTVAVGAAFAAVTVGAYGALREFEKYDRESAAYGATLLSEKPWMGWCVIAVIGLGLDVAGTGAALKALGELAPAAKALDETGNLVAFEAQLAKISKLEQRVQDGLKRAAALEEESKAAWKAFRRTPFKVRAVIPTLEGLAVPVLEYMGRFVWAVFLSARKGAEDLAIFLRQAKLEEWYEALGPELKVAVQEGHIAAIATYKGLLEHADELGLTQSQATAFLKRWGEVEPELEEAAVRARMTEWAAQHKQAQALAAGTGAAQDTPFGFRDAEHWQSFKATATKELKRALKGVDRNGEAYLQGSSVTGLSYKRKLPFDAESDFDVAVTGRDLFKKASKVAEDLGVEVKKSPSRIALTEDLIAALDLKNFARKLRNNLAEAGEGFDREVKIMLFQDLEAARKPIGEASAETVRQTIPLTD